MTATTPTSFVDEADLLVADASTALLTDMYELTMLDAALADGTAA
jgi:nicotinic acid phosphoribosyltransferase